MPEKLKEGALVLCVIARTESTSDVSFRRVWQMLEPAFKQVPNRFEGGTCRGVQIVEATLVRPSGAGFCALDLVEQRHGLCPIALEHMASQAPVNTRLARVTEMEQGRPFFSLDQDYVLDTDASLCLK